ncbi:hypothetical protein KP509_13G008000 [Ceratopteris richardii]|uniref:Uncharacterized protein n=1 Tax=Ceratopteris richardii TaxID=49495 RepID=A0A8T2TF28_CERRI|nr:hypothetical protein KP509_13G008000 [Ceratopteris richardii]
MTDIEGVTIGILHHFMTEAINKIQKCTILDESVDPSCDILESTPIRDDLLYLIEKRWKKRLIHGFVALLHPDFKEPSLLMDSLLLEDRDIHRPKILSSHDYVSSFRLRY